MYTQCPDCKAAFRVAADDLRQAAGKVRCGDCGAAFNALPYLSEDMPEPDTGASPEPVLPELKHELKVDHPKLPETISANESIALLQTLDELAGSDVRIEDTGIEWRVLDEVAMSEMGTDDAKSDDQPDPDTEVRYDDDSPLPDELATDDDQPAESETDSVAEDAADNSEPQLMADTIDADEIDDSGDWEAILEDIDEPAAESIDDEDVDGELAQPDEEAAQEGDDLPADDTTKPDEEENDDENSVDESQDESHDESGDDDSIDESDDGDSIDENQDDNHDESGDDSIDESQDDDHDESGDDIEITLEGDDDAADDVEVNEEAPGPEPDGTSDEDSSPSQWQLLDKDEHDDSIPTLTEPHEITPGPDAEAEFDDDVAANAEEDFGVESIVLEGDSVSFALEDTEAAASLLAAADAGDFSATSTSQPPPVRSAGRRSGLIVVVFLLLAALGLQAVHQQRQILAKIPAVNNIIGPLYRMVGRPLAPAWDVTGWSFEATSGNAEGDDEQLNIYTRIGNQSDEALPYPLIGVSLTDRFEEIIGSRVLEPSGYLPGDINPRKLVAPGESFEAFIAVESPDTMASGYKLDVCYRLPDRRLRCAIGDFR